MNNDVDVDGGIDMLLKDLRAQNPSLNDSDEFNPDALLSAPYFDDSNGELNHIDDSQREIDSMDDFDPDPVLSLPEKSVSDAMFFEPTPIRADQQNPERRQTHLQPMFDGMNFPGINNLQQQIMLNQQPTDLQKEELQATLQKIMLLEQLKQMQMERSSQNTAPFQQGPRPMQQISMENQPFEAQSLPGSPLSCGMPMPLSTGQRARSLTPPRSDGPGMMAYSDAMEKLCETMKRSAMSRTIVKQLSGRNLCKQGSQRNLSKQGSQRSLVKQNSGRNLMQTQLSNRSLGGSEHDTTGRMGPVPNRRPAIDTKHRIARDAHMGSTAPGRGVFRHNSCSALLGARNVQVQLDDSNLGYLS